MKDIKQYIGTKTAIECQTPEQFEYILNQPGRDKSNYTWQTYKDKTCIDTTGSFCDKKWYFERGYAILPASDFIEEREVIGYRFNELGERNRNAIMAIMQYENEQSLGSSFGTPKIDFLPTSKIHERLSEAGVLDIWTTKVYKEKPKYEKGEWYYGEFMGATWVCKHNGVIDGYKFYYTSLFAIGDSNPIREYVDWCTAKCILQKATYEQLKMHFEAAAKVKGYKEGMNVESMVAVGCKTIPNGAFFFKNNALYYGLQNHTNVKIFDCGTCEWAEIITEPKLDVPPQKKSHKSWLIEHDERLNELEKTVAEIQKQLNK